jgi:hypothetical protein
MAKKSPPKSPPQKTERTIDSLRPDQSNSNRGTERGSGLLENVLRKHGAARSIVLDADDNVIAGNHVLEAAQNAGITRLRVIETDGQELVAVKRTDVKLNSRRGRELSIADNAIALRSIDLDGDAIARQTKEFGLELDDCGISEAELAILVEQAEEEKAEEPEITKLDTTPPPAMSWVLIGIPTVRFGDIAAQVEKIAGMRGVVCETTVRSAEESDADQQEPDGE